MMNSSDQYDYRFKVSLIGDFGVGKTCLFRRFVDGTYYAEESTATLGMEFTSHTFNIDRKTIRLDMWDTSGQERYRSMTASYFRGADGIAIFYDVTNKESFINVKKWVDEIDKHGHGDCVKILIGTKSDLSEMKVVDSELAGAFADQYKMAFIETSAKSNSNVEGAFRRLAADIKSRVEAPGPKSLVLCETFLSRNLAVPRVNPAREVPGWTRLLPFHAVQFSEAVTILALGAKPDNTEPKKKSWC